MVPRSKRKGLDVSLLEILTAGGDAAVWAVIGRLTKTPRRTRKVQDCVVVALRERGTGISP